MGVEDGSWGRGGWEGGGREGQCAEGLSRLSLLQQRPLERLDLHEHRPLLIRERETSVLVSVRRVVVGAAILLVKREKKWRVMKWRVVHGETGGA